MTDTPIDYAADYAAKRRNMLFDYQNAIADLLNRKNSLNTDYTSKAAELNLNQPNVYRRVLNNYAGRGMAFGTGYGNAYQDAATQYANQMSGYQTQRDAGLAQAEQDQGKLDQELQYNLDDLAAQQAAWEATNKTLTGATGSTPAVPSPTVTPAKPPAVGKVITGPYVKPPATTIKAITGPVKRPVAPIAPVKPPTKKIVWKPPTRTIRKPLVWRPPVRK